MADRAAEVAAVVEKAIAAYREHNQRPQSGVSPSPSSSSKPSPAPRPSASKSAPKSAGPLTKKAKTSAPVPTVTALPVTADLWEATIMGTAPSPARTSSLFGHSLPSKPQSQVKPASSSLFGTALSKGRGGKAVSAGRQTSPGFEAVRRGIHTSLAPPQQVAEPTIEAPIATSREPETVAFVPAAERKISAAPVTAASTSDNKATKSTAVAAPAPAASAKASNLVDEDGIIKQVKKRGKKSKKGKGSVASDSAGATPEPGAPDASQTASSSTSATAPKKVKVSHKDIPAFDYANETNLLDQPKSSSAAQTGRKPKADKKGKKGGSGEFNCPGLCV